METIEITSNSVIEISNNNIVEVENSKQVIVLSQRGVQGIQGIAGTAGATQEITGIAGENLSALRVVAKMNNAYKYISSSNIDHRNFAVGITKTSAIQDEIVTITTSGVVTDVSWNWDVTKPILLGDNGFLTQLLPINSVFSQVIAQPVSANSLRVVLFQCVQRSI